MHGLYVQDSRNGFPSQSLSEVWNYINNSEVRTTRPSLSSQLHLIDCQTHNESYLENKEILIFIDGDLSLSIECSSLSSSLAKLAKFYFMGGIQKVISEIRAGSFNLVIYDKISNKLLFITDFIGSIPLYYGCTDNGIVISTNAVAAANSKIINRSIDNTGVASFIHFGHGFGSRHILKELNKIPANHCLSYDLQYKKMEIIKGENCLFENYPAIERYDHEKIHGLITQACRRSSINSGKTASFLSGGLDSRMVTAAWPKSSPLTHFTYGATNSAEILFAKQVAELNGEPLNHIIPTGDDIATQLEDIFNFSGLACFPERFHFSKIMAQQGFNSVNDGFLIDIFLGGEMAANDSYFSKVSKAAKILGIFVDQSIKKYSSEAIAEAYFDSTNNIKSYKQMSEYLDPDFISLVKNERDNILHDITNQINVARKNTDVMSNIFISMTVKNHSTNYTSNQGVNSRQHLKVNYPLGADKDLIHACLALPRSQASYRKLQLSYLSTSHPEYAKIPYSRTLIPVTYPAVLHKWASILNNKNIFIPKFNSKYKDKTLSFSNWPDWIKNSDAMQGLATSWLISGGVTTDKKLDAYYASLQDCKKSASGHMFHVASVAKWIAFTK